MSTDQEAREDELLALASIYGEDEFHGAESGREGEIRLYLDLPLDFRLLVGGEKHIEYAVRFLPPLVLRFQLPLDYPSASAPTFTLSSKWLSRLQLTLLCKRLDLLWQKNHGSVVLFTWIQFLKEETLDFLDLQTPLKIFSLRFKPQADEAKAETTQTQPKCSELDPRAILEVECDADLLCLLLDFDEAQRQKVFNSGTFCCGICLAENPGADCLLFKECQHVYCKACVKEYFQVLIRDGQVQNLTCPKAKCTSVATPSQVKLLVEEEEYERYDRLLLRSTLNRMADIVYCPRVTCGMAVVQEPNSNMGICLSCSYAFCTRCNRTYHGISRCKPTPDELRELLLEEERKFQKELERLEVEHAEVIQQNNEWLNANSKQNNEWLNANSKRNNKWLKANSKQCPFCSIHIQKDGGCDVMYCVSCNQSFYWSSVDPV